MTNVPTTEDQPDPLAPSTPGSTEPNDPPVTADHEQLQSKSQPEPEPSPAVPGRFCLLCCQQGAESALKDEVLPQGWRLAFSRPGFVTFKQADAPAVEDSLPTGIFVRTAAWSIGKILGSDSAQLAPALSELLISGTYGTFDALHLWSRDRLPVGERGFQPGSEPLTEAVAEFLAAHLHIAGHLATPLANQIAREQDRVLDVIMVEPAQWWIGWHGIDRKTAQWPGGAFPIDRNREVISRAYFKTAEALAWSGLPIREGDHVIEIGSSPGGSVQRLLEIGMRVTGIDPAEMDESIMDHPSFKYVRARGGDIKRQHYARARWLLVDSNVKPDKTLTTVENVVQNERTSIEGLVLTLKLSSYERAEDIPLWIERIRSWGYANIQARQLATGKKEICVVAT